MSVTALEYYREVKPRGEIQHEAGILALPVATLDTRNTRTTAKLFTRSRPSPLPPPTTDVVYTDPRVQSYVHAEWEVDPSRPASGMAAEVVVRVQDPETPRGMVPTGNGTQTPLPPYPVEESPVEVIVRAEEILLVVLVLVLWVAAIALFFNRWGKIRMLEPYQPKFQQQHRTSCPMGDSVLSPQVSVKSESEKLVQRMKHAPSLGVHCRENGFQQRMSFSKYNVNFLGDPAYTSLPSPNPRRQRQNSVFVGSSTMAVMNPPRRVKSAIDIQHMVLSDYSPGSLSGCSSLLPMFTKRPSITVEKIPTTTRNRRQSMLDAPHFTRLRRPSVLPRHRHFISFDQPSTSWDRRTSVSVERPRRQQRSLEEQPALVVQPPSETAEVTIVEGASPKPSSQRSCPESMVCLHQPRRPSFHLDMPGSPGRHRLSVSLDNPAMGQRQPSMERRNSNSDAKSCYSSFDETQIKLSNLEYSKVSDV